MVTARQAARILGRSPSTISRALAQGRLNYINPEKKLLLRSGLEQHLPTPPGVKQTHRKKRNVMTLPPLVLRLFRTLHHHRRSKQRIGIDSVRSWRWCWKVLLRIGPRHKMHIAYDYSSGPWMNFGVRLTWRGLRLSSNQRLDSRLLLCPSLVCMRHEQQPSRGWGLSSIALLPLL